MKIIDNREPDMLLVDIAYGTPFYWNGSFYIKARCEGMETDNFSAAVNLETGEAEQFNHYLDVEVLKAKIILE